MNPLLSGALIGAGMGVLKGQEDRKLAKQAQNQWASDKAEANKLNAVKSRYSQWTGHRPQDFRQARPLTPGLLGPIMQGGMAGAMMGQGFKGGGTNPAQGPATPSVGTQSASDPNAYMVSEYDNGIRRGNWNSGY